METNVPALSDPRLDGFEHRVVDHGPVSSLQEAAAARGVAESAIIKTMVVRISDTEYVFVLVPGDRIIDWAKLRNHLGVNRLSLPDEDTALAVTGYVRGTITPFGATNPWPVHADLRVSGQTVSIGGGRRGVSLTMSGDDVVAALGARLADLTRPAQPIDPAESAKRRQ